MLSTRGAAHHCPADTEAVCAPAAPGRPRRNRIRELGVSPRARENIVRPRLLSSRLWSVR